MDFLNFIPLENRGMSILTALTFFFYTIGFTFWYSMIKRELKRINVELQKHDSKINDGHDTLAEVKTNVALLLQSVTRIEKMIEFERRDNK